MDLTLLIGGKEKIFTPGHVSAKHYLTLMGYDQEIDYDDMTVDDMKKITGFVCDVFNKQFTIEEFLEGTISYELLSVIGKVFSYVRTGEVPKDDEGNEEGK